MLANNASEIGYESVPLTCWVSTMPGDVSVAVLVTIDSFIFRLCSRISCFAAVWSLCRSFLSLWRSTVSWFNALSTRMQSFDFSSNWAFLILKACCSPSLPHWFCVPYIAVVGLTFFSTKPNLGRYVATAGYSAYPFIFFNWWYSRGTFWKMLLFDLDGGILSICLGPKLTSATAAFSVSLFFSC